MQDVSAVFQHIALGQGGLKDVLAFISALLGVGIASPLPKGQFLAVRQNGHGQQPKNIVKPHHILRAGKGQQHLSAVRVDGIPIVHPFPVGDDGIPVGFLLRLSGADLADKAAGPTRHGFHIAAAVVMGGMDAGVGLCHAAGFLRADVGAGIRGLFLPFRLKLAVRVAACVMGMPAVGGDRIALVTADMGAVLPLHRRRIAAVRRVLGMVLTQPVAFRREGGRGQKGKHHNDAQRQRQKPLCALQFMPKFHIDRPFLRFLRRLCRHRSYTIILIHIILPCQKSDCNN